MRTHAAVFSSRVMVMFFITRAAERSCRTKIHEFRVIVLLGRQGIAGTHSTGWRQAIVTAQYRLESPVPVIDAANEHDRGDLHMSHLNCLAFCSVTLFLVACGNSAPPPVTTKPAAEPATSGGMQDMRHV